MSQAPQIPTGKELYDAIMGHIEPELTSEGRQTLKEKYNNETPAERRARGTRYEQALARYEEAFNGYIQTLQLQVGRYQRESLAEIEIRDRTNEETALGNFDQAFLQVA